ncbi:MAG TPA: hypothetical protein VEC12_00350 [Bacteroidia bacterium]|nr:hypothetical protein [Bacteroidia bacterium]
MLDSLKKYGIWLSLALGGIVILLFYGKLVVNPNSYLFSSGGDGIKNYYTFAWHINYDSSYTHFRGMNYPYGEHVVFTDNQPLISNAARFVNTNIVEIGNYAVGINNILLFVGLLAAIGILYKIFHALTRNTWFAVAAAVVIGMMSPQIDRFDGHFALAYCFVVPLFIWWSYKFFQDTPWRLSFAMSVTLLALLFIHVYYLVIIAPLLLLFWLFFIAKKDSDITVLKAIPHIIVQIILPFGLYFLWLKITDTFTDRPAQPYGIVEYAAYWEGLLLPLDYEYFKPLKQALGVRKVSVETIAYAGLPVLLFILWGVFYGIPRLFRKNTATAEFIEPSYNSRFLNALLYSAIGVFVYAAFFPYLFNIPSISKYLGLLKQFRSLGRLLWVVFYGLNIFAFVYIFNKTREKRNWLPWAMLVVLAIEATVFNIQTRKIIESPYRQLSWIPKEITPDKYNSIIPIPFFHEGSENIGYVPKADTIVGEAMLLSWQTGIPLQAVKMSRTSLSQTLKQLEFAYEVTKVPSLLSDTTKPYLILHYIPEKEGIPYLSELTPIAQTDSFSLYEVTPDKLAGLINKYVLDRINSSILNTAILFFTEFEKPSKWSYREGGSLMYHSGDTVNLMDTVFPIQDSVTVSFWIYAHMEGLPQLKLLIETEKGLERVHVPNYVKAVTDDWMLVEYFYKPVKGKVKAKLIKEGTGRELVYIDNLLIRNKGANLVKQENGEVMFNNRYYRY